MNPFILRNVFSGECKVRISLRIWSSYSRARTNLSTDDSVRFLYNPREVARIVPGQNDPQKIRTLHSPDNFRVFWGNPQRGLGGKTYRAIWAAGGERTIECPLQKPVFGGLRKWDSSGLCPLPPVASKENDRAWTKGGEETYHKWGEGPELFFGEGFYGMFSPPLSFPPPFVFSVCFFLLWWGIILKPRPPHTRQNYEQRYGP